MSAHTTSKPSGTDWSNIRDLADDEIVADDVPYDPDDESAVNAYWAGARLHFAAVGADGPKGQAVADSEDFADTEEATIHLSPDVLSYFRATGKGWQDRIDAALKEWIRQH